MSDAESAESTPPPRPGRAEGRPPEDGADRNPELPDRHRENRPSAEAAEAALVRRPKIGDSRPAPPTDTAPAPGGTEGGAGTGTGTGAARKRRRRGGRGRGRSGQGGQGGSPAVADSPGSEGGDAPGGQADARPRQAGGGRGGRGGGGGTRPDGGARSATGDGSSKGASEPARGAGGTGGGKAKGGGRGRGGRGRGQSGAPVTSVTSADPVELTDEILEQRRGKERKGRPVGRYLMAVHVQPEATQIAILEGRALIEHQVARPADDIAQIHGNIYIGKVQNVLPGMEAAFVDIGTPKNAVLYRGDTRYDPEDLDLPKGGGQPKIEQILKARQTILCQVTKNPIAHKGARLTQEVSLPGRFVVLVPNSTTYGISKRLPDDERKRLRQILDRVRPEGHGLIVRTAAEGVTAEEIERDVRNLAEVWRQIEERAAQSRSQGATLLYREPDLAVRVIREEFTKEFRKVVIDDRALYEEVRDYVRSISPELEARVELHDDASEPLPLFEKHHIHEQLHKALDRKVWLPSGGSLIIEHTEALTVIDVNTGKNVGSSSLEDTVYANNLEAAVEVARQLRLRDIGGIIVIDFIDMEVAKNREDVIRTFREALARDKTRTQVFDISELGLVEMTRKRIGEGLLESFASGCPTCEGRGVVMDPALFPDD